MIDGERIEFAKARKSHWDGKECLYAGRAADGSVKLFESDQPGPVITTSAAKLRTFAEAVMSGEFEFI
ncbi:hypothetical protein GCM10011581_00250 [Saccharopolyspora subtropica]|uniref:DUF397 domain-containing protein n=1 Tax=Saccharopolyspora thermophila TaxID=89367 RepID=A0A917JJJ8_9PSEU|nr:hypothetical protein GCM10011581_00250 [Saccharopolyspora subtropica]